MQNPVALLLLWSLLLVGSVAAQPTAAPYRPQVPTAFDVAGLHLVLNPEAQRLVQQKADGLCRHQPSFQARVDLADAAFPIIDRVLQEEGVPLDFRYLALQESALQGDARSAHEAVGYWQLKQETATGLGLAVNADVDERQHLAASTRAAARYLARNNNSLHNWLNALLSYNTGLSGVQPYTLPSDFDATEMAITEATSPYVLMFLAHKVAFEPVCGQNPRPPLRLQEFPAQAGQPLEAQALALHTDPAALAAHNRWLLAAAVPADRAYTLLVPVGDVTQAAGIVANQRLQSRGQLLSPPAVGASTAEVSLNGLRALVALPGETTADLARRGHRRLGEFLRDNELTAFDGAVAGRPYYLQRKHDAAAVEYHVLQPGETVFDVAQKYGLRQKAVFSKNRLSRNDELRPGRVLWLQHTRPREVAVEYRSLTESVALERPSAGPTPAEQETDALLSTANEAVAARRAAASESGQTVKVKIKVKGRAGTARGTAEEDKDGWGEALSSANAASMPASPAPAAPPVPRPAPAPVVAAPAPRAAPLPPAAPAPAPAALADEPAAAPAPRDGVAFRPPADAIPPAAPAPRPALPRPAAAAPPPAPATDAGGAPPSAPASVRSTTGLHTVQPRETAYGLARLYNVRPADLFAWNNLPPNASLAVGQVLRVQPPAEVTAAAPIATAASARPVAARYVPGGGPATAAPASAATHTVAAGETLFAIAQRYKVKVADLLAWNNKPTEGVRVGEVLRVRAE